MKPATGASIAALLAVSLASISCSHHRVTTLAEWCQQISGVDIMEKNAPFWAVFPSISFDGDSIRDDFVATLDAPLLDKVGHRTAHMVWREGTTLHLENLSTLMEIPPDSQIAGWRRGIERSMAGHELDRAEQCVFGSTTSLFDSVTIHSGIWDAARLSLLKDSLTTISTDRKQRLGNPI